MSFSSYGRLVTTLATLFLLGTFLIARAHADTFWAGPISASNLYGQPTQTRADVAHVSLVIANTGEEGDVLLAVDVPPQIAAAAGFDDLPLRVYRGANLRRSHPIYIKAGETRLLGFDNVHLVIYGIQGPFTRGFQFPVRLTFEKAGVLDVLVEVGGSGSEAAWQAPKAAKPGLQTVRFQTGPAPAPSEKPVTGSEFRCNDGSKLVLNFSKAGEGTDIDVWSGGATYHLPYQPPKPGPVQILWSDGENSLTWNPGVNLMWIKSSSHLMCGRSHHDH